MDKELIAEMAKKAGGRLEFWMTNPPKPAYYQFPPDGLAKFAALVAEECAKKKESSYGADLWSQGWDAGQGELVAAIRAKFPLVEVKP